MFSLFRKKNRTDIDIAYNEIITQSRQDVLYTTYNVPDKPIGRFQMILLHAMPWFMGFARNGEIKKAQALFDRIFSDIELSFREIGVGDLSVPKKMKRYMQDFNGVLQAHMDDNADHSDITRRQVFGDEGIITDQFAIYIKDLFHDN